MEAFGNAKLGLGVDRRAIESTKRTGAQTKALDILKKITQDWKITYGTSGITGLPPTEPPTDMPIKSIGLTINNFKFPNETNTPRLDFDERMDNFKVTSFNKTEGAKKVILNVYVFDDGGNTVLNITKNEFTLDSHSNISHGPFGFVIRKEDFPPGKYTLRCVLLDSETKTKDKIDSLSRLFWVAEDPKLSSPFDLEGQDLPDEEWEWSLQNRGGSRYTLYYNQMHPIYLENNEDAEKLGKYIGELCCLGALQLYIKEVKRQSIEHGDDDLPTKGPIDPSIINQGDPELLYKAISKEMSSIRKTIRNL